MSVCLCVCRNRESVYSLTPTRFVIQLFSLFNYPDTLTLSRHCPPPSLRSSLSVCTPLGVQGRHSPAQCTVYSGQCTVYSLQCKVYSVQYTVYSLQCTVYSVRFTVYSLKCTVYSVQFTVYSLQCTVYNAQHTVYSL